MKTKHIREAHRLRRLFDDAELMRQREAADESWDSVAVAIIERALTLPEPKREADSV